MAALLVAVLVPEISRAQGPVNQGNLSANGRRLVYKSVVAVRGKSDDQNRIIVLATVQPLSAAVLEKVNGKDADENVDAEVEATYLKAIFQEDGSLVGLIGLEMARLSPRAAARWKGKRPSPMAAFADR